MPFTHVCQFTVMFLWLVKMHYLHFMLNFMAVLLIVKNLHSYLSLIVQYLGSLQRVSTSFHFTRNSALVRVGLLSGLVHQLVVAL